MDKGGADEFVTPGDSSHLNLGDNLVLGGINNEDESTSLPMELFAGVVRKGFVGCMKNLIMEAVTIDLERYVQDQLKSDEIMSYCR